MASMFGVARKAALGAVLAGALLIPTAASAQDYWDWGYGAGRYDTAAGANDWYYGAYGSTPAYSAYGGTWPYYYGYGSNAAGYEPYTNYYGEAEDDWLF